MNILIFSRGYPSIQDSQWGCFERDQARALQKMGHSVTVISVDGRFRLYPRKLGITYSEDNGIHIYNIYLLPFKALIPLGYKLRLKVWRHIALYLYNHIQKGKRYDLIYAHYLTNIYLACAIKHKYSIPIVGIEHWSVLNRKKLPLYVQEMGKIAYSSVDRLIVVSDSLRQQIFSHFGIDSIVIHNMVSREFFERNDLQKNNCHNCLKIVSVGNLLYGKGHDVLIKAFYHSNLQKKGASITIVGEGKERGKLQHLINQLGLQNNVFLVGRKNKSEVLKILLSGDFFVHPSRGENFSVAIIEALSVGLPVIATLCGGAKDCISAENGILVPIGDVESLSAALISMSNNKDSYDREYIIADCRDKYSENVISRQLDEVFYEVINEMQ